MGKPSKGTKRDRRLKKNKRRRKAKSKLFRPTLVGKIGK